MADESTSKEIDESTSKEVEFAGQKAEFDEKTYRKRLEGVLGGDFLDSVKRMKKEVEIIKDEARSEGC